MKDYKTITDLKTDFISGAFEMDSEFRVNGVVYRDARTTTTHPVPAMILNNHKGVHIYESANGSGWLMFLWGSHKNTIIPYDVRATTRSLRALNEKQESNVQDRIIPDKVEVQFLNIPIGNSLVAKVDTGAEMCSLHASDIQVNKGQGTVSFTCQALSRSRLTMPLADQQAVKTSGGDTTYRPVVKVDMKIRNKILKDMQVNLNDRSEMNDPMLVGQNALQAGNFLIDPNIMKEGKDLLTPEFIEELKRDVVIQDTTIDEETSKKLYEALTSVGKITVGDLIKLVRTEVMKNINDVSY